MEEIAPEPPQPAQCGKGDEKKLPAKYESKLSNPPLGKNLHECWNAEKRRPTKEYQSVIGSYKKSMREIGIDIKEEARRIA